MNNAHQMVVAAKEASIANAAFYLDVKKFKVLDAADVDDDDDGTSFEAAHAMQPLRISADSGSVSVYDLLHDTSYQEDRHVTPIRSKRQHDVQTGAAAKECTAVVKTVKKKTRPHSHKFGSARQGRK
jgi:hypothetical protein